MDQTKLSRAEMVQDLLNLYEGKNKAVYKLFLSQKSESQLQALINDELRKLDNFSMEAQFN